MKFVLLAAIACLFFTGANAQVADSLVLEREVNTDKIVAVSNDRRGLIYVADDKGNILRFDSTGKRDLLYSPQKQAQASLIDAWNGLRIFVFYRDYQEYLFLDRFLADAPRQRFPPELASFARMATTSADDKIWLFDDTDFSLKKYDYQSGIIALNTPLSMILTAADYDINFMREYQNQLYINNRNGGILVFDNMGNYRKKLPVKTNFFSFTNDAMVYLYGNNLRYVNIYTGNEKQTPLPNDKGVMVLVANNRIYLFTERAMLVYKVLKPAAR